jgi:(p)ppGpp synthase/HD superfamily hydrolase
MKTERRKEIENYAIEKHAGQKYGNDDYSTHLRAVGQVINRFGYEFSSKELELLLDCAWLHDILEDTTTTKCELDKLFGSDVANLIYAVSDEQGKTRKERHERTYPKLKAAGRDAIAVKLADRIANCQHSLTHNHSMLKMYQSEYPEFKAALHLAGELKDMWAELDVLMSHKIEPPKEKKSEIQPIDAGLVNRACELVRDVQVDLNAPLSPADE